MQDLGGGAGIGDEHRLGDLQLQPVTGEPGAGERLVHRGREGRGGELHRGDVDGDLEIVGPAGGLGAGLAQHPFAEARDEPDLLGEGNELGGRHPAALRMRPAQQRLEAADPLRAEVVDRLVMDLEGLRLDRVAQVLLQPAALVQAGVHVRLEETEAAAALGLGAVEGDGGALEQAFPGRSVARRQGDAEGDPDAGAASLRQAVGRAENLDDPLREDAAILRPLHALLEHHELVGAEAGHGVDLPRAGLEAVARRADQLVADRRPEGVVDPLEAVEIDLKQREAALAGDLGEGLLDPLGEHRPVRKVGERVVARQEGHLRLRVAAFGDVLVGGDEPAVGELAALDGDDPSVAEVLDTGGGLRALTARVGQEGDHGLSGMVARVHAALQHILGPHTEPQGAGRQVVDLAVAAVDHPQAIVGVVEAEPLAHVVQGGIKGDVRRLEPLVLLLELGDVRQDRDVPSGARGRPADPQPAPVRQAHLAILGRDAGGFDAARRLARLARPPFSFRPAEEGRGPRVGENHGAVRVEHHHALAQALQRLAEQGLRAAPAGDLLLHAGADVVAHRRHGAQKGAHLVAAALGDRIVEMSLRDPLRRRRGRRDRADDPAGKQPRDQGRQDHGEAGGEGAGLKLVGDDAADALAIGEAVAGGLIDEGLKLLAHPAGRTVESRPIGGGLGALRAAQGLPFGQAGPDPLGRCGAAGRVGALHGDAKVLRDLRAELVEDGVETGDLRVVPGERPVGHGGLHLGEVGRRGAGVVDRHEGLVVGALGEVSRLADADVREQAETAGDGAHGQERDEDAPADRHRTARGRCRWALRPRSHWVPLHRNGAARS
ncbi:hypothetical protein AOPFMNJM_0261 [Methylobacterium jeotgali]|uniref:Uncharacterized protein n=1 Tax=Methylobacterium jeotgali TaxID=381630 RepID=A0ABQ4SSY8_9HYPH|nr:hypothetical protein AOPFMNJM_0261 [Methylobacterium jeotgali]